MAAGDGGDPFLRLPLSQDSALDKRDFHKLRINELRVVVVSNPNSGDQIDCILAVGAGMVDDPLEYPGMAHLVEHLFCREETGIPPDTLTFSAKPEKTGYYNFANAYTVEDVTVYICRVRYDRTAIEKLQAFLGRFSSNDFGDAAIKYEARTITQEFEWRCRGKGYYRAEMVSSFFQPACKALRNFFQGNLASLMKPTPGNDAANEANNPRPANVNERLPIEQSWIDESNWDLTDLKKAIKEFTEKHYKLKNCVLLLQANAPLQHLEDLAKKIWDRMTIMYTRDSDEGDENVKQQQQQQQQEKSPQKQNTGGAKSGDKRKQAGEAGAKMTDPSQPKRRKIEEPKIPAAEPEPDFSPYVKPEAFYKKIYYVQPVDYEDQIFMNWIVDYGGDEEKYSRVKPLEYVCALLRCSKNNTILQLLLRKKKYITEIRTEIARTCYPDARTALSWSRRYKVQMFTIIMSLTQHGIAKRDYVIAAVLCYIRKLQADEKTYNTLRNLRDMKIELFGVTPYSSATENANHVACAVLYPEKYKKNILTDYKKLHEFDKGEIERVLAILGSVDKLNVMIMAHIGKDVKDFNPAPAFNVPNQPLEFCYGVRDFSPEEIKQWSAEGCQGDKYLSALLMPTVTAEEIEFLQGNSEWEALIQQQSDDTSDPTSLQSLGPVEKDEPSADSPRRLAIRKKDFKHPYTTIKVQLLPPLHIPSPKVRAYMTLFVNMLKIRAQWIVPTWAQAECSTFDATVNMYGAVKINISGLHHFALRWLVFLFKCLSDPKRHIESMSALLLEFTLKEFMAQVYDPQSLCRDLMYRGTITGYAPLFECYQHLLTPFLARAIPYPYFTLILEHMKITAHAVSNMPDSFSDAIKALKDLPPYKVSQPTGRVTEYYTQLTMTLESPPGIHMSSPNTASHLSTVEITYRLHGPEPPLVGWEGYLGFLKPFLYNCVKVALRESAGMTYTAFVTVDTSALKSVPNITITVSSDCRWFRCNTIRERITQTLDNLAEYIREKELDQPKLVLMGYYTLSLGQIISIINTYLTSSSPLCRRYIVELEGHRDLDMITQRTTGLTDLQYDLFMPAVPAPGFTNHLGQTRYLEDVRVPKSVAFPAEQDLALNIPPVSAPPSRP